MLYRLSLEDALSSPVNTSFGLSFSEIPKGGDFISGHQDVASISDICDVPWKYTE